MKYLNEPVLTFGWQDQISPGSLPRSSPGLRDATNNQRVLKSILFMCELAGPDKQSPLHKPVGQCLLSILALYDPVFPRSNFQYLDDTNL